jgi:hypothetical protein
MRAAAPISPRARREAHRIRFSSNTIQARLARRHDACVLAPFERTIIKARFLGYPLRAFVLIDRLLPALPEGV